eukprot:190732-Chlamydomonas_euryale.AAC.9
MLDAQHFIVSDLQLMEHSLQYGCCNYVGTWTGHSSSAPPNALICTTLIERVWLPALRLQDRERPVHGRSKYFGPCDCSCICCHKWYAADHVRINTTQAEPVVYANVIQYSTSTGNTVHMSAWKQAYSSAVLLPCVFKLCLNHVCNPNVHRGRVAWWHMWSAAGSGP